MKKCEYTLTLKDKHGITKWERSERKRKLAFMAIDSFIDENWLQTPDNQENSLMQVLIHLEKRRDYGLQVLRAGVRRDLK